MGTLAEDRSSIYFEYAPEFIASDLNLSPFHLPFETGLFEHKDREFGPLPGLFDDSLPDGWGLLLMDRFFRSQGRFPAEVSALDRLSWLGARTMGALTYHPTVGDEDYDSGPFDLHELASQSAKILAGQASEVLPQLLRAGGSPGGARPKVLVGFNPETQNIISGENDLPGGYEHWIIKFGSQSETKDTGAIEFAYGIMAGKAGINLPQTRIFETSEGDRFFGIKRFDREGTRRFHIHTFGNLIQSNFRIPSADYSDLLKATSLLTRNHQEVLRAYRRMVFNVLAHNRDDHVKNFSFIMNDQTGEWGLSPAYDLLFSHGPGGEHTMTLSGEGKNPGRDQFLKLSTQIGVSGKDAEMIIEEVQAGISQWRIIAQEVGVSTQSIDEIENGIGR